MMNSLYPRPLDNSYEPFPIDRGFNHSMQCKPLDPIAPLSPGPLGSRPITNNQNMVTGAYNPGNGNMYDSMGTQVGSVDRMGNILANGGFNVGRMDSMGNINLPGGFSPINQVR